MSRTSVLAVGIACLSAGFVLGNFASHGRTDAHPSQRASSDADAPSPKDPAQSSRDATPQPIGSQPVSRADASADSSGRPADLRALATCASRTEPKAAERCLQQLDAIGVQDPAVRRTFLQLISTQQDPTAKARIFENITPAPLPPEDLMPFLKELESVRGSSDPEVRADGLIRTAAWDRSDAIAGVLREGLYDPNAEVVRAAATAVLVSNVRTQDIKEALLALASDATPDSQLHRSALEALGDFSLNREEYLIYRAARDRVDAKSRR
ncbi:hypothetical protein [Lysobacter sp. yr284]|uniref:hypothetical protein n=1 Tax=Lysobacter sp. yr284 TaxID=1761791 RepID=UPI000B85D3A1|nr:hypothetical protein [Lysobacter sp. yr284]